MLAALRRARYGYLLALHILLLCAAGRTPTEIAAVLFCSRSSVYRTVRAYREGTLGLEHDDQGRLTAPRAHHRAGPHAAAVAAGPAQGAPAGLWLVPHALELCHAGPDAGRPNGASRSRPRRCGAGSTRSAGCGSAPSWWPKTTIRSRVERLARIRWVFEQLKPCEAMVFADELDIHLLPKVGLCLDAQRDPAGGHDAGPEPEALPGRGPRSGHRDAAPLPGGTQNQRAVPGPARHASRPPILPSGTRRLYVVVDNYKIHKAKAVEQWLATHPRVTLLFLPTYCPRANPIERAFGDVHDCCTRNHQRKRLPDLVADVEDHLHLNGPWQYKLSDLYYEPAVTAAVEKIAAEEHSTSCRMSVPIFMWTDLVM